MGASDTLPTVGVVIATHNRPAPMRKALASVLDQEYDGDIRVILVFDKCDIETNLASNDPHRNVSVLDNVRTPGLAGARNSGILALETDLVAFCDDDDLWLPGKLGRQVERMLTNPEAEFVTTAMTVNSGGRTSVRLAGKSTVSMTDLARSRMAMLHSSSFMFRRHSMVEGFGLVDESMPSSMAEDWDLLLRAARRAPIEHVDEPLVEILWASSSYFLNAWADKNDAHAWLLEHHPEISLDSVGLGLQYGKLAFGHAVLRNRRAAAGYTAKSLRANWREPRGVLAVAVLCGVSGEWIQTRLNQRGHGI